MRLQPMFAHVHERYVPAPGVDAADADAARGEVESRFAAHATTGGQIFVAADTTSGARVDQYNVERLQLVANALKLCRHFSGRDDMTVWQFAEVELGTGRKNQSSGTSSILIIRLPSIDVDWKWTGASIWVPLCVVIVKISKAQPSPPGRSS